MAQWYRARASASNGGSTGNLCNSLASNSISFIFNTLQGIIRYLQLFSCILLWIVYTHHIRCNCGAPGSGG